MYVYLQDISFFSKNLQADSSSAKKISSDTMELILEFYEALLKRSY